MTAADVVFMVAMGVGTLVMLPIYLVAVMLEAIR